MVAFFAILITDRYPQGVFDFMLGMDRWVLRVAAYAGLLTGGAVAIWADQTQRDADGYLTTGTRTFRGDGYALEFETVDLQRSDDTPIRGPSSL
ncbi:MAG TPA: hypothetical protein VNO31_18935 [Umezawaea sp.]|nr:hypothetical protein [Umezawaea sp.]